MINKSYADFAWEQAAEILAIDSPTGFTARAAAWAKEAFEKLGYPAKLTTKGGVLVDLGGENSSDALMLAAHADTLGAMVAEIKGSGRLRLTNLGGMRNRKRPGLHPGRQSSRGYPAAVQRFRPCQRRLQRHQAQLGYH